MERTKSFGMLLKQNRQEGYQIPSGVLVCVVCMTSDFLVEEADAWHPEVWEMMANRPDLNYMIITKHIVRLK
ncbi:hypothetical protein [Eubacterium aggregans]|uniref:hypothetical protein n=1 Tax=Eubacterium aggregans TaxID=81409 RepID=UPI003F2F4B35